MLVHRSRFAGAYGLRIQVVVDLRAGGLWDAG